MNVYTVKNCKNCPYIKCSFRVGHDFDICPVEKRKQGILNA
ncbi:hypothetical protein [Clostridium chromiireducens]|nr:hypothetical protein [Clostridium chromiireducens]